MAFCRFCGSRLDESSRFCRACGKAVDAQPTRSVGPIPDRPTEMSDRPFFPLLVAAILSFSWAGIFACAALFQIGSGVAHSQSSTALLGAWNALIVLLYVFIGYGVLRRHPKAYEWGVGTNCLNAALGLYQLLAMGVWLDAVLLPIEASIVVILLVNKSQFGHTKSLSTSAEPKGESETHNRGPAPSHAGSLPETSVAAPVEPRPARSVLKTAVIAFAATVGVVGGIVGVVVLLAHYNVTLNGSGSAKSDSAAPKENPLEKLAGAVVGPESKAITAAKQILSNNLKSPSTARWASETIVDRRGNNYVVFLAVDSQKEYSAMVRSSALVAVELTEGAQFKYNPLTAINECSNPPLVLEVNLAKALNGWESDSTPEVQTPSSEAPVSQVAGVANSTEGPSAAQSEQTERDRVAEAPSAQGVNLKTGGSKASEVKLAEEQKRWTEDRQRLADQRQRELAAEREAESTPHPGLTVFGCQERKDGTLVTLKGNGTFQFLYRERDHVAFEGTEVGSLCELAGRDLTIWTLPCDGGPCIHKVRVSNGEVEHRPEEERAATEKAAYQEPTQQAFDAARASGPRLSVPGTLTACDGRFSPKEPAWRKNPKWEGRIIVDGTPIAYDPTIVKNKLSKLSNDNDKTPCNCICGGSPCNVTVVYFEVNGTKYVEELHDKFH